MQKNLLYSTLLAVSLCLFAGCKDDAEPVVPEPPVPPVEIPPTLGDIVATYAHQTLKLTVNGEAASANASVTVVKEQDSTMTLQLGNVVPDVSVFSLPKSTFEVITRSIYASKISGFAVDSLAGYEVKIDGNVTDTVLTAAVTLTDMGGVVTNVKSFYNKIYKGDMTIGDSVSVQRVYTSTPTGRDTSSIKLQIDNFSFSGLNLGTITLDTLKVLKRGTIYAFKAKGQKLKLPQIGEVMLDVTGTMIGQDMNLSLVVNAGPLVVDVDFGGKQVTERTDTKATITLVSDVICEQPVMKGTNYTFKVWDFTPAAKLLLTPKVELAEGAVVDSVVIDYGDGKPTMKIDLETAIDFSKFSTTSCVKYYVVAEDVRKSSVKSLFMEKLVGISALYTMENWVIDAENGTPTPAGLTNSNSIGFYTPLYGVDLKYFLVEKGSTGSAEIRTFYSVSLTSPQTTLPGITAGILFNGSYKLDVNNWSKSPHFGEIFATEPMMFKFSYKYTPGSEYYMTMIGDSVYKGDSVTYHYAEIVPNMKDSCSINAYLYEVSNLNETLDGTNINTSSKVILKAVFSDGKTTDSYLDKEISFVSTGNGIYDPKKLYKLAIVCSSSIRGDQFMGAPGSILTIQRLEVFSPQ